MLAITDKADIGLYVVVGIYFATFRMNRSDSCMYISNHLG